jgi:hypothetical protein
MAVPEKKPLIDVGPTQLYTGKYFTLCGIGMLQWILNRLITC